MTMRPTKRRLGWACLPLLLGGCAGSIFQDQLLGYPGLGNSIRNYYDRNAWEKQATCPTPELQGVYAAEVVERQNGRIVARVRYGWWDPSDEDTGIMPLGCQGIDERLFTVDVSGERPRVISMTGEQRPPPASRAS